MKTGDGRQPSEELLEEVFVITTCLSETGISLAFIISKREARVNDF
jgi:hypothetical protein